MWKINYTLYSAYCFIAKYLYISLCYFVLHKLYGNKDDSKQIWWLPTQDRVASLSQKTFHSIIKKNIYINPLKNYIKYYDYILFNMCIVYF